MTSSQIETAACLTPSPRQLAWQELEFYGFLHFGMNTFTGCEWGDGTAAPARFAPAAFDADQWAEAAKAAGMRGLILTCKHHDGFCLWPSRQTGYTVAASPWRDGCGDAVREVSDACRRAGLKFGVYLSPWDRHEPSYGSGAAYDRFYIAQLTELLTQYGDVFCVWLDGACGEGPDGKVQRYDWDAYYAAVRRLQPNAVICVSGPDVRWCGNEAGHCRPSEWSVVPAALTDPEYTAKRSQQADDAGFSRRYTRQDEDLGSRAALADADTLAWYPAEVNTSIRPGWFYHTAEDTAVRTPEELFGIYLNSVGGNANFLLNVPPTPDGLLAQPDVAALRGLGDLLRRRLGHDLAGGAVFSAPAARADTPGHWQPDAEPTADAPAELTLTFAQPTAVRYVSLREDLTVGQRVESGEILCDGVRATAFTVVGARRICALPQDTVCTRLTVRLTAARLCPALREVCVY